MLAACGPAPAQVKATDPTPTPATIDVAGWTTSVHGVGPQASVKNGRLELTLPWSTHNDQNPNDLIVKVVAPCRLSGDFEITIHYKLLTWPLTNGAWIGIGAGTDAVARVSLRTGSDNNYATYLAGTISRVGTHDMAGSVRLGRVGGIVSGYSQDASGAWIKIASATSSTDPVPYAVQLWSDAGFGKRDVVAAVDSLTVSGTKVNCS